MKKDLFLFKKLIMGLSVALLSASMLNAATYYVDPASGNINNNGSEASPWNTLQNVISAGKSLSPGDVVYLKNGNHGFPAINNRNNAGVVTVRAYPGHNPIINRLSMSGSSNWAFEGVRVYTSSAPPEAPVLTHPVYGKDGNYLLYLLNCTYVTFDNCYVYSIENSAGWSSNDWNYKAWNGIRLHSGCHHITIKNSLFKNLNFAIDFFGTHTNTIQYNTVQNFCGDGMRVASNCVLEYNKILDAYQTNGNHVDAIQGFASSNAVIRGNTLINSTSSRSFIAYGFQGIGLFDGFFDNYIIENNLIVMSAYHAIALFGARNCRVVNNTVIDNPLAPHASLGPPWIDIEKHKNGSGSSGNIVRNNITPRFFQTNGASLSNNLVTTALSTHFVNPSGLDYRLKSTSSAVNAGTPSLAPTTDLNRFPRTGNPDIGCYELGSVNPDDDDVAPSTPGTPSVTSSTIASVTLSWSASTDNKAVAGYIIYVNGVETQTSTSATATVGGLNPGTSYSFTVRAFDLAGNQSSLSSAGTGSTQSGSIITASSATASSYESGTTNTPDKAIDGNLTTRWAASGDGQWLQIQLSSSANITDIGLAFYLGNQRSYGFDLQYSTNGTSWTTIYSGSSSGTTTNVEVFNVTDATASYIRYLGHGNSSNTWNNVNEIVLYSAGPADTQAPSVPGTPTANNITTNSVDLSWSASTDNIGVAGYKIYIDNANPITVTGTSATVNGLADATQYSFSISAIDAAGNESAKSSSVNATTLENTSVTSSTTWQTFTESTQTGSFIATFDAMPNGSNIDAVTGILNGTASAYSSLACIIRFNSSGNIDARNGGTYTATNSVSYSSGQTYHFRIDINVSSHTYTVYVTPQGGSEVTLASNFAFRTEQASVSQLTGWAVYAYSGSHSVDNMNFSTGLDTQAPSVPGTPSSSNVTENSVDLSWSASTDNVGVTGYKVYIDGVTPVTSTGTSTTISGLAASTQYSLSVSAVDAAGNESAQSSSIQVTTSAASDTQVPSVPGTPTSSNVTSTSVTLSWSASTDNVGVTGYKVYTGGSNPVTVSTTSTTISGLASGTQYSFTVSAIDAAGNESSQSSAVNVTTTTSSGITSNSTFQSFTLSTQTASFTATFDAVPNGSAIDAVTGIQNGAASAYSNMACIVRFNSSGNIDARNGGSYAATNTISYSSGVTYHFRVEVDVTSHTYSVFVTPNGGSEQTVASNFAFRSEQASVSQLTGWSLYAYIGSHTVSDMAFSTEEPSGTDIISNGEFDSGTTDWAAGNYGGTAAISAVTGQGMSGTNALQISISSAGTNPWDIQIYQDIEIENGHTYQISFQGKAAASRSIDAVIQDTDSPYSEYWHGDIDLTTSAQSFGPYTFNSSVTDATCRFKFFVAGNASTVYIDNVVVTDVTSSSAEVIAKANTAPSLKLYPNPLNGNTLTLAVNEYGEEINVRIFDMTGRSVYNQIHNVMDQTELQIPVSELNKGIYIVSVSGEKFNEQQKLIIE